MNGSRLIALAVFVLVTLQGADALADRSVIKNPGNHPDYIVELEPHLVLGVFDPPGLGDDFGFGAGFRGAVEIVDNGFVKTINNTVAIGFGLDWVHYDLGGRGFCRRISRRDVFCDPFVDFDVDVFWFPVVMQWNFWLSENWSVFGEPGFALQITSWEGDDDVDFRPFVFYGGGRFHFTENITLTMRIGWPTFSVGVSFLL